MGTAKAITSLSNDAGTQTDNNVIHDLLIANSGLAERAFKAEKAYLKLQLQMELDKLQTEKVAKERDIMTKLRLYEHTDQEYQIKLEFQSYLGECQQKRSALQEIHKLFEEALTRGLILDDLPDHRSPVDAVRAHLKQKLRQKALQEQGARITLSNSTNGLQPLVHYSHQNLQSQAGIVPSVHRPDYMRLPQEPPQTSHHLVNNGYHNQIQAVPQYTTVPATTTTIVDYGHASFPQSTKHAPISNNGHTQSSFSKPSSPAPTVNKPGTVNVKVTTSNDTARNESVKHQLVAQLSAAANTAPAVQQSLADASADSPSAGLISTDNVAGLDDFVIDDDMFQNESTNENTSSKEATSSSANTVHVDDNDSSDSASVDDDEEFAKNMATVQSKGDGGPVTKLKASKKVLDDIDWKSNLGEVVQTLASRHKISRKLAEQCLDEAYRKVGSIDDLGLVYKEAEKSVTQANRPFSTSSLLSDLPAASSKTKLLASASTTNATAAAQAGATAPRTYSSTSVSQQPNKPAFSTYKTSICKNWFATKRCPHGDYCLFAHGKGELRATTATYGANTNEGKSTPSNYFKVILCRNFKADGECKWGDNCIFAHGEHELRGDAESTTASGQTSSNSVEDEDETHPEPCDSQQCPARLNFLLRKTSLCGPYIKYSNCRYGKECKFAHGEKDLVKMPKWEMCERHLAGRCMHADSPSKCVYAHSEKERRPKPAAVVALQRKNALATSRGIAPARPAAISASRGGSTSHAWNKDDANPGQRYDEECLICMNRLEERPNLLKCGHDSFHAKCISRWVNEGLPECPMCRAPAKLPDLYSAPAGFKPVDFPGLGI